MSTKTPGSEVNYLELPDDEVMQMMSTSEPAPPREVAPTTEPPAPAAALPDGERVSEIGADAGDQTVPNAGGAATGGTGEGVGDQEGSDGETLSTEGSAAAENTQQTPPEPNQQALPPEDESTLQETPPEEKPTTVQSKAHDGWTQEQKAAAFDELMAPFKANGRVVELNSPDELATLRSMGANYTKKMQALQPQLRVVKMLENNGLLDEGKLSFLIDLHQKKPLAIQKLIADSQFDPMTVDADQAASYTPGDHQVSDSELQFQSALDSVLDTPTGGELLQDVQRQWDAESKQALFQNPEILLTLNQQKELGLYSVITNEMERLRVLGQIGPQVPFLQAYRAVGEMLHDQGRLGNTQQQPAQVPQPRQPVEVRTAAPAARVTNNERAKAAAPTRTTTATSSTEPDYLALPDDQFLKEMQGRL